MTRSLTQVLIASLAAALASCGPPPGSAVEVGEPVKVIKDGEGDKPQETKLDLEAAELKGVVFDLNGLDTPEMPGNGVTVKRSIADQRKKAKGKKVAERKDLALLLWYTAPTGADPKANRKLLREQRIEALNILVELAADPKAPEDVVWARAVALQVLGEDQNKAAAWDDVIGRFPDSPNQARWKALRNYNDLKLRAPLTHPLVESLEGAPYEAAYVSAWAKYRAADGAGAVAGIMYAAKNWTNLETLPFLRRDVMLLMSRGGGQASDAMAILQDLVKKDNGDWNRIGPALADAFNFAGEYGSAAEVYESLAAGSPPAKQAEFKFAQALVWYRLVEPGKAADAVLAAWALVADPASGATPELQELIAKRVIDFAMIFHSEYAKTHDARFAEPAKKLYDGYLTIPGRPDAAKVKDELKPNLEQTITTFADANTPKVGAFDAAIVTRHVKSYLEQVGACYEAHLQGDPALAVDVSLTVKIGADGKVADAAGGDTPVGQCLVGRAKGWTFPATGTVTVVTYPVKFAPQPPKTP